MKTTTAIAALLVCLSATASFAQIRLQELPGHENHEHDHENDHADSDGQTATANADTQVGLSNYSVNNTRIAPNAMMISRPPRLIDRPTVGPELTHSKYLGLMIESHNGRGLKVYQTTMNGSAATIGLEKGDIVIGANGFYVDTIEQLEDALRKSNGWLEVTVIDVRSGSWVNSYMKRVRNLRPIDNGIAYVPTLGVEVEKQLRGGYKITRVDRRGVAEEIDLTVGDVLLTVNSQKIESVRNADRIFNESFTLVYDDAESNLRYTLKRRVWTP